MTPSVRTASLAAIACLNIFGATSGSQEQAIPPLPDPPPIRTAPWTPPPNRLPKEFVEAVVFLQAHGLADPRGGVFGEDRVTGKDPSGKLLTSVAARGWLMPGTKELVLLNGIRAPLVGRFNAAPESFKWDPSSGFAGMHGNLGLAAAMFFVRGDPALARNLLRMDRPEPELNLLARDLLAAKFHAAVEIHSRGDDATALRLAQELRALGPIYEAKAAEGLTEEEIRRRTEYSLPRPSKEYRFFSFLRDIDDLAFDSWRRLHSSPKQAQPIKIKDQSKRIAALIQDPENVSARQWGQPGGIDLHLDPRVMALINEGDDALEPLLTVIQHDKRLTRSFGFFRDFHPSRNLVSVSAVAKVVVEEILGLDMSHTSELATFVSEVKRISAATKGMTRAEKWMYVLGDDSSQSSQRQHAALCLLDRDHVRRKGGGLSWTLREGDPLPPIRAESLKDRTNPSLIELLSKRFDELHSEEQSWAFLSRDILTFALKVHDWDPEASRPFLRKATAKVFEAPGSRNTYNCHDLLAKAVIRLHRLGDRTCLAQWAAFMRSLDPSNVSDWVRAMAPLHELREVPLMKSLVDELFTAPGSAWNLSTQEAQSRRNYSHDLANSRLIELEPVRRSLGHLLSDRTNVGSFTLNAKHASIQIGSSTTHDSLPEGFVPNSNEVVKEPQELLAADWVAAGLKGLKGAPKFELFWGRERKDKALAELRAFIEEIRKVEEVYPWFKDEDYPL